MVTLGPMVPSKSRFSSCLGAAAGLILLCSASQAAPVYQPPIDYILTNSTPNTTTHYNLDVNGDSVTDFRADANVSTFSIELDLIAIGTGAVSETGSGSSAVIAPMANGSTVGSATSWSSAANPGTKLLRLSSSGIPGDPPQSGLWANDLTTPQILGLKFIIGGVTHYGWIRVGTSGALDPMANLEIYDWAFESLANTPITIDAPPLGGDAPVPEPATLGLFVLGAAALAAWKHRRA